MLLVIPFVIADPPPSPPPPCVPTNNAVEICDGLDNDCNTFIDDNLTLQATTCGLGACFSTGFEVCVNGTLSDNCTMGASSTEICDNIDNDCNGVVDNIENATFCGEGQCMNNTGGTTCIAGNWSVDTCDPFFGALDEEICSNNLDDDCTGGINNGCSCVGNINESCGFSNNGECILGTRSCIEGNWSECVGAIYPVAEICDGLDNDCDNLTDEDLTGGYLSQSSVCGTGICSGNNGTEICINGSWNNSTCDPFFSAVNEICKNSLDDDCDGLTDEGCGNGGHSSSSGGHSSSSPPPDPEPEENNSNASQSNDTNNNNNNNDTNSNSQNVTNQTSESNSSLAGILNISNDNNSKINSSRLESPLGNKSIFKQTNIYFGILFIFILVGALLFSFRHKIFENESDVKTINKNEPVRIIDTATRSNVEIKTEENTNTTKTNVDIYIDKMHKLGYDDEFIRQQLKSAGHTEESLDKVLPGGKI